MRLWSVLVRKASRPCGAVLGLGWLLGDDRAFLERGHELEPSPGTSAAAIAVLGGPLLGDPVVVLLLRHDPHRVAHLPVVEAAVLGAAADVLALLGGRDVDLVVDAGDEVALRQEVRHPERVGDVGGDEPERGRPAHRDDHLRRLAGLARDRDVLVPVVELPRPLEADHVDPCRRLGVEVGDVALCRHAEAEQHRHDHHRRRRVEDLQGDVVAGLVGDLVVAPAVAQDHEDQQAPHQRADGEGGDEEALPQREDALTLFGLGIGRPERRDAATGRPAHQGCGCDQAPSSREPAHPGEASPPVC